MKTHIAVVAVIIVLTILFTMKGASTPAPVVEQPVPIATVSYYCDAGKTISAIFYSGETKPAPSPDQSPTPSGSVALTLSYGHHMTLPQTISADGARYANDDESFIFWNKGNGAFVLENDQEKSYSGCIAVAPESTGLSQVYASSTAGFSIRLPGDYIVDEAYKYQELGPKKDIYGIKFTIPTTTAAGTNLSPDTYVSVEKLPLTQECIASPFLNRGSATSTSVEGSTTYSVASSTGAAAGNRYEETVYALSGTNPCVAVRYFVHYGVIQNYPAGAVHEFDKQALLGQFDAIRRTLVVAP